MTKNEITNEKTRLLKRYYSYNSTLSRLAFVLLAMLPFFYVIYEPLPRGSLHLVFFAQVIVVLLVIVASQINWKLDLILKIYNLDKQGDNEYVEYEPKKQLWVVVLGVLIVVIVGIVGYENQKVRLKEMQNEFDSAYKTNHQQIKESPTEAKIYSGE